ncbi:MAG: ABC transporter substrate-binding protein [Acidimicrobiia bacterium]
MPNQFLRALGACIVVLGVGVAGAIQVADKDVASAVDIVGASGDEPAASSPPEPDAVEVRQPIAPFVYKVGLLGAPTSFNFWEFYGSPPTVWDSYVLSPTKASLYRLDNDTLTLVPELASRMATPTWNRDGWRVVVPLRSDNRFSDGEELTAEDVAFTFATARKFSLGGQWEKAFPKEIVAVNAIDSHTLEIEFTKRPSLGVWPFGTGTAPVMSSRHWSGPVAGALDAAGLFRLDPTGDPASGPLEVVEASDSRVVSHPNSGYAGPEGETVEYLVYLTSGGATDALVSGQIHTILSPRGMTVEEARALEGVDGVDTIASPIFGVRYLAFNTDRFPMDNVEFRRAVALLVDRDGLADSVGGADAAHTILPAANTSWFDDGLAPATLDREKDLEAAFSDQLTALKESGYSWGVEPSIAGDTVVRGSGLTVDGRPPAPLTVLTAGDSYDAERTAYAGHVADAIEVLGFEVVTVITDFDSVIDLTFTRDESGSLQYDMALLGWSLGNPGLPSFYADFFGSGSATNNTGYDNPAMDELIRRYEAAPDPETARALLWEMEGIQARDLPYLPLYSSHIVEAYRSDAVSFRGTPGLGGIQGALGAFHLVAPAE